MRNSIKLQDALLFQALTVSDHKYYSRIESLFKRYYGNIQSCFGPFKFNLISDYYLDEMGPELLKMFYIFKTPVSLENFYRFKLESQSIENKFLIDGKRTVNIDPGSLTLYQLSLLTTKAFSHRTYLAEGIYAECTLLAKGSKYQALDWTYPDYKTTEVLTFFEDAKKYLKTFI